MELKVQANKHIGAVRNLNLHEYQSKILMEKYNVSVQRGKEARTAHEARKVAEEIKSQNPQAELILKAQIHAGGRGKGHFKNGLKGGVKILNSPSEVEDFASQMLGQTLVTHQTGPNGQAVNTVLINEGISITNEMYFAILLDRTHDGPVIVASSEGGMDIEEVAANQPEKIITTPIDVMEGLKDEDAERIARSLGFQDINIPKAVELMKHLYELFIGTDATQVEINPLAEGHYLGGEPTVFCVDAKLNFDSNAEYRQKDIFAMRDTSMEDPRDVEAEKVGLSFIGLDGVIGCMVNGAGLAMATLDIIQLKGGTAANFLDVGGGASADMVSKAFNIITSDPKVKAILINIFGGIMKCDVIAEGVVEAAKQTGLKVPLVVRLEGTNVEKGKEILEASGLNIITADDLDDAAVKAVAAC